MKGHTARKEHTAMQIIDNIPVFGEHEANTLEQARAG